MPAVHSSKEPAEGMRPESRAAPPSLFFGSYTTFNPARDPAPS